MSSQPTSSNVIHLNIKFKKDLRKKPVQDYLADYGSAVEMVKRLTRYYHSRNYTNVKVWIETDQFESGRKRYSIRSNIVFKVPTN